MGLEKGTTDDILYNDFFQKSTDPQGVNTASPLDHPSNCSKVGTPRVNISKCKLEENESQYDAETHVSIHSNKH